LLGGGGVIDETELSVRFVVDYVSEESLAVLLNRCK
jgi:hypothetical protein